MLEVDIAHSGQTWEVARAQLLRAVQQGVADGHSGVKIVHGRGQSSGYGTIKEMAKAYLTGLAVQYGGRVAADKDNPGATILWLAGGKRG
jgi:DNA-nicking Smr family endonuclease